MGARGPQPGTGANANGRGGPKDENGLTVFERRFVDLYLVELNGTEALARMDTKGRDRNALKRDSHELRHKPHVAQAIEDGLAALRQKVGVTQEQVVEEYRRIAFSNILDFVQVDEDGNEFIDLNMIPRDKAAAISEFETDMVFEKEPKVKKLEGAAPEHLADQTEIEVLPPPRRRVMLKNVKIKTHNKLPALEKLGVVTKLWGNDGAANGALSLADLVAASLKVGAAIGEKIAEKKAGEK